MRISACFLSVLIPLIAVGQERKEAPKPIPDAGRQAAKHDDKTPEQVLKKRLRLVAETCVCSVYPVYEDNGSYLYYAELCEAAAGCPVLDTVYFWDVLTNWPLTCAGPGDCGECDEFSLSAKVANTRFNGMTAGLRPSDQSHVPWPDRIPHQSDMTRIAHPKRGHKADLPDFVHFRTTINGTERDIYAKLFVSKVVADAANVNAPKPGTMPRFLHIGYELRTRPPGEIHEVAAADVTPAIQKVPPAASDTSQYALKINFANEPYLVLLVRRP